MSTTERALWAAMKCLLPDYGAPVDSRFDSLPPGTTLLLQDIGYGDDQLVDLVASAEYSLGIVAETDGTALWNTLPRTTVSDLLNYLNTHAPRN